MRVIINDKRYGALKTLGERKQAFNEVNLSLSCVLCSHFNLSMMHVKGCVFCVFVY